MDENRKPHPSEQIDFVTSPFEPSEKPILDVDDDSGNNLSDRKNASIHTKEEYDDVLFHRLSAVPDVGRLVNESSAAAATERRMTFLEGLRLYPKAMGWCALIALTIVMEAYDLSIVNAFFAFPDFVKRYGNKTANGSYQVSTSWQSALTNGGVAGEILGLFFNGVFTDRYGYRRTLMGALLLLCLFIFLAFFAFHIQMLMASEVLSGLSWGVFQTLSTTYAAEVMPVALRAYLTSNVNLCWLIGQLIGVGVLRGCLSFHSEWAYRVPFGLQWVWAVPILIGVILAPESPWWFVRHNRTEEAKQSLLRLTRRGHDYNVDETIAMMQHTNEIEKHLGSGSSYLDCFKGADRRRTEIACVVWITQAVCGSSMTGYATYFYRQAGFSAERAFDLSMGMYGLAIVGGMLSWIWMRYCGRRTLYLWGCTLCTITMLVGGAVGTLHDSPGQSWALGSVIILFTFFYDSTIGPVCYSLVAEIASTRLRVKTVVLARISYNIASLLVNVVMPKMLNPTAWNWKGKTCYFWAGTCSLCWVWCYFRLPEPKGLTYLELDLLFEKGASARKFRRFKDILTSTGYFSIVDDVNKGEKWNN